MVEDFMAPAEFKYISRSNGESLTEPLIEAGRRT
jgi:hypothetical protein